MHRHTLDLYFFQGLRCYDLSFSPTFSFSISVILSAFLCLYLLVSVSISWRLAILAPPLVDMYVCVHVCVCMRVCVCESVCDKRELLSGDHGAFQNGSARMCLDADATHMRKASGIMQMRQTRQMQIDEDACIRN